MIRPARWWWPSLLLLLLAALALRLFRLDAQSLWYDEAFSVYLARSSLGEIIARTAADIQPPLYYLLLHAWISLAGQSEFAVRWLSLASGLLMLPALAVLAHRLFDCRTALLAVALALVSPLYLWYSQETRMYTLLTLLGLLSSYFLLRLLFPTSSHNHAWLNRPGSLALALALTTAAALYTHYFAAALLAFQLVFVLLTLSLRAGQREGGARARPIFAFFGLAGGLLLFSPWTPFVLQRLGEDASYWRGDLKLDEAVRHIFINFTLGESVLEDTARVLAAGWLAALLVGLAAWLLARRRPTSAPARPALSLAFALLYLILPLALLLLLFSRNPKFNARYLMLASPAFLLLLAVGLASLLTLLRRGPLLARSLAAALLLGLGGFLLATSAYADNNAFFDPAFTKADFRGAAAYIAAHARPDDAIILTSGHLFPAFDYYFPSPLRSTIPVRGGSTTRGLPELRLPDDPTLNADHILDYPIAADLNRALAGRHAAWVLLWQDEVVDPNGLVPELLSTRASEIKLPASFWQVKLRYWERTDSRPFSASPEIPFPREANFKNQVKLLGYGARAPTPADTGLSLTLYWQPTAPVQDDLLVALRVVDAQGKLWGVQDRRPAGYAYPAPRWKPGQYLFGSYTIPLTPGAPPGDYFVTVTLYTTANPSGLHVLAPSGAPLGKSVRLGPVPLLPATQPPPYPVLKIKNNLSRPLGPFTLLRYELGQDHVSSGDTLPLSLLWRADALPTADYTFRLRFGDGGQLSAPLPLANASYPTSRWRVGEIIRGEYLLPVPPETPAGAFPLALELAPVVSDASLALGTLQIDHVDRVLMPPKPGHLQPATFGDHHIALLGYDYSSPTIKPGSTLTVTLYWGALARPAKPYTVFVHLLDKDNHPVAQRDAQPLNGSRPTQTWVVGEYLSDPYPVEGKPDLPPGEYRVEVGWYDSADPAFARLPALDAQDAPLGDHVLLSQPVVVTGK